MSEVDIDPNIYSSTRGSRAYEIVDHLGNVHAVLSDRRMIISDEATDEFVAYENVVLQLTDYYPFGMVMTGRSYIQENQYRYGFNGKELDPEGMGGGLTTYDYGFRIYNPAIAKFLSVDPLTASYPWYTPYQFAGNMPIWAIDLDGLEPVKSNQKEHNEPKFFKKLLSMIGGNSYQVAAEIHAHDLQEAGHYNISIHELDKNTTLVVSNYDEIINEDNGMVPITDECGDQVLDECGDPIYTSFCTEVRATFSVFRRSRQQDDPKSSNGITGLAWRNADLNLTFNDFMNLPYIAGADVLDYPDPISTSTKTISASLKVVSYGGKWAGRIFGCKQFAKYTSRQMLSEGKIFGFVQLTVEDSRSIFSISRNKTISTNGYHVGIVCDGKVYDNLNPNGVNFDDWIKDFDTFFGYEIKLNFPDGID